MGKTAKERMQAYRARLNSDPVKRFSFLLLIYYYFIMDVSATTNILIDDILKDHIIPNKSCDICKKSVLANQRNNAYHCNKCNKWTHKKCNDTTEDVYLDLNKDLCFSLHNIPFTIMYKSRII